MKRQPASDFIIPFAVIVLAIIGIFAVNKYEDYIRSTARQQFETDNLPKIQQEMRDAGFNDLEIDVEFKDVSWEEWTERVYLSYRSNQIDDLYTTIYDSENSKELTSLLLKLRDVRDKYCAEYKYNIHNIDVNIRFEDDFSDIFVVKSKENVYRINTEYGFHSLKINDDLMYYSGSSYPSSEISEENKVDKLENIEIPQYLGDLYDVYDYDDPADFYYDREDAFESYEEAEDYWNEAWDEVE